MIYKSKTISNQNQKNWSKPQVLVIIPKTKIDAIVRRYIDLA
ncbi:hypothetical protein [Gloeothece verrucosa]|uniref:Uncharacterized protein n=1 Tax=Gloeothece verrucosa (strain PCC 7822) TaxID=497965 RepID=E0U8S3_GLOV7|nr:hypothetical protein [Gloeothece verrucosa]ADN14937.1 hypothetical protein Cyan7822_2980 [Gloeothece verrucosa PCC 7822]